MLLEVDWIWSRGDESSDAMRIIADERVGLHLIYLSRSREEAVDAQL